MHVCCYFHRATARYSDIWPGAVIHDSKKNRITIKKEQQQQQKTKRNSERKTKETIAKSCLISGLFSNRHFCQLSPRRIPLQRSGHVPIHHGQLPIIIITARRVIQIPFIQLGAPVTRAHRRHPAAIIIIRLPRRGPPWPDCVPPARAPVGMSPTSVDLLLPTSPSRLLTATPCWHFPDKPLHIPQIKHFHRSRRGQTVVPVRGLSSYLPIRFRRPWLYLHGWQWRWGWRRGGGSGGFSGQRLATHRKFRHRGGRPRRWQSVLWGRFGQLFCDGGTGDDDGPWRGCKRRRSGTAIGGADVHDV